MSDLTQEEIAKLVEAFNKLKVKPKADTPEDLELWLKGFGKETEVKVEPGVVKGSTLEEKIKTSVSTVHQPRISLFYGDNSKGEATYAQWVYEVKCLLLEKVHKPEVIAQAIRNSLRGEASNLLRRLGYGANISDILEKFDSVYGEVDSKEHLLAKFYSSKQEDQEDVTKWSCRLEDILASAVERKLIDASQCNEMLRNMFYQGLKPTLKDICAFKFEQIKDFDQLRVAIRKIEQDHLKTETNITYCNYSVNQKQNKKDDNNEIKEMKSMIQALTNTVQQLESKVNSSQIVQDKSSQNFDNSRGKRKYQPHNRGSTNASRQNSYNCDQNYTQPPPSQYNAFNQSRPQEPRSNYRNQNNQSACQGQGQRFSNQNQGQGQRFNYRNQGQRQGQRYGYQNQGQYQGQGFNNPNPSFRDRQTESNFNQAQSTDNDYDENFNRGPLCFRCRQYGHYQWECGVRMDHSRKHLN